MYCQEVDCLVVDVVVPGTIESKLSLNLLEHVLSMKMESIMAATGLYNAGLAGKCR